MSDSPERVVFHYCEHALHEECPAMMVPPLAGMAVKLCACACHREIRLVDVSEWATEYRVVGTSLQRTEDGESWHSSKLIYSLQEAERVRARWNETHPQDTNVIQSRKVGPWT